MDLRKNMQVVQPNVEYTPDNNGWPEPLTDPSSPLKQSVTNGRNGEQNNMEDLRTSQMKETGHHLPEGRFQAQATQADPSEDSVQPSGDPLKTSQQKRGEHKTIGE